MLVCDKILKLSKRLTKLMIRDDYRLYIERITYNVCPYKNIIHFYIYFDWTLLSIIIIIVTLPNPTQFVYRWTCLFQLAEFLTGAKLLVCYNGLQYWGVVFYENSFGNTNKVIMEIFNNTFSTTYIL